tara:strand:+ start:210 stop:656 length:447 start_codon:yes stop_codon:yes gene_type:complete
MKKTLLYFIAVVGITAAMAFKPADKITPNADGITFFKGTFDEALKASAEQGKPIFMDSYTTWCYWCKELDKKTFTDADVIAYLNENFINLKMDMEKGEGPKLAQKYNVKGYPTLLFLNSEGTTIGNIYGFATAESFLKDAKAAKASFK